MADDNGANSKSADLIRFTDVNSNQECPQGIVKATMGRFENYTTIPTAPPLAVTKPPEAGFRQEIVHGPQHIPVHQNVSSIQNQQHFSLQGTIHQQANAYNNQSPTPVHQVTHTPIVSPGIQYHQSTYNWPANSGQVPNEQFKTTYGASFKNHSSTHGQPPYQNAQPYQAANSNYHSHQEQSPSNPNATRNFSQSSPGNFHTSNPQGYTGYQSRENNQEQEFSHTSSPVSRQQGSNTSTPEFTRITDDLADKIKKYPHNTIVPFYIYKQGSGKSSISGISHGTGHGLSGSSGNVRLPHSPMNKKYGSQVGNWDIIVGELSKLKDACYRKSVTGNFGKIMQTIVTKYCSDAHQKSNFGMLGRGELANALVETIPLIVEMALLLPQLVESPFSYLKSGESKTIYLTRKLSCSLLANAFFCTFPESSGNRNSNFPDFNFFRLFNDTNSDRCEVKKEKIKCILEYFGQFYRLEENIKHQIVSFERRCVQQKTNWAQSNKAFCKVHVESQQRIEQADGMLQCDFANKFIGGGVINDGSVMEEIRFCISPELIVSRLFTEAMNDNEVVVITGSMICSDYTGYSTSFKFTGPFRGSQSFEIDNLGRTRTQLVAIDALSFKKHDSNKQYQQHNVDRELHKCYVAFIHGKKHVTDVATGNWGCGAFNGDPELKFLIQWMAASQQDRGLLQYHVSGDPKFVEGIIDLCKFLDSQKVEVGQLYKSVVKFNGHGSVFQYVKDNLKRGNFMSGFFTSR